jgi:heme-degrading monooxygenase HmoA
MISRQWCGLAKPAHADAYVEHLRKETFPQLSEIPGFIDASILRRNVEKGVEFLIVTRWESIEGIQRFTGRDPDVAVVPPKVREIMIEYDQKVRHYEVVK